MAADLTTLPHISTNLFLTDGGLETTLVFLKGIELSCFAAFDLLNDEKGSAAILNYYREYLDIAKQYQTGFILESPTWRANPDWIEKLGYPVTAIKDINEKAIQLMVTLKEAYKDAVSPILMSGCVGPRGDGYQPGQLMSIQEAAIYHAAQINVFANTGVDLVTAITMNYVEEAIGIALAANAIQLPVVISFTVETDGKLATGLSLKEAIEKVDDNVKEQPLYYMINCSHPAHFMDVLLAGKNEPWIKRIKGIRANASCKSHAELDEATELDRGDPDELSSGYRQLKNTFTHLNVFGGCCGTDKEHIKAITQKLLTV
jgi:S-methylmethionine-dependent homocysteine/selenocysteine methylase